MDKLREAFEAQFGTEWSIPVNSVSSDSAAEQEDDTSSTIIRSEEKKDEKREEDDSRGNGENKEKKDACNEPFTVTHSERTQERDHLSKRERRYFMATSAPKKLSELLTSATPEKDEDLKKDIALQRLISESHILSEQNGFSGADISGASDPLETTGKTRLKIMEARLSSAGAKISSQRMPQTIAQGIKKKAKHRESQQRAFAAEAGVILAKHAKAHKQRNHDRGIQINTVGKATSHGVTVSKAEISRISGSGRNHKGRGRNPNSRSKD